LLNHSCDPNISKYFNGAKVFAVANRKIFKGNQRPVLEAKSVPELAKSDIS
jgi:hypothetical protein